MKVGEAFKVLKKHSKTPFYKELKTHNKNSWLMEVINTDRTTGFVIIEDTEKNRKAWGINQL